MNKYWVISQTFVVTFLAFLYLCLFAPKTVLATDVPSFPLCSNPQGSLKVEYDSGNHGVVGDTNEYQGKDSVYIVDETTLIQCLCTDDGRGIQTDWWRVMDLAREEIEGLRDQGWIYVASGAVWGLDPAEYLAKSVSYSCSGDGGSTPTPTPTPTPTSTTTSSGGSSNGQGGVVLAAAALAPTGNIGLIYSLLAFGFSSIFLGISLRKKETQI